MSKMNDLSEDFKQGQRKYRCHPTLVVVVVIEVCIFLYTTNFIISVVFLAHLYNLHSIQFIPFGRSGSSYT